MFNDLSASGLLANLTDLDLPERLFQGATETLHGRVIWNVTSLKLLQDISLTEQSMSTLERMTSLRSLQLRLTCDEAVHPLAHLRLLQSLHISFGIGRLAPTPSALAAVLDACTQLTRLHFTFAQSYPCETQLITAVGQLTNMSDLQINGFDIKRMPEDSLVPLRKLKRLHCLELSGLNILWNRRAATCIREQTLLTYILVYVSGMAEAIRSSF